MIRYDRFILNYQGNKYHETKKYFKELDVSNYDIIVEPFAGIFGFSRALYEMNPDYDGVFWINDIDPDLIAFYKQLKKKMRKTIQAIEDKMENIWTGNNSEFSKYLRKHGTTVEKLLFRSMNCDTYNYVKGLRKINNFKAKIPEYKKLFKKLRFKNKDIADLKIPTTKRVLVFYDPPYFDSCNKTYMQKPTTIKGKFIRYPDNTKLYLDVLNKFKNYSFDQIMIINFTCLMHHLFGEYEDRRYDRQYNNQAYMKRKTAEHIVYSKLSN